MMLRCPPLRILQSTGFTAAACTRTSKSRGPGEGLPTSSACSTEGSPYARIVIARTPGSTVQELRACEAEGGARDRIEQARGQHLEQRDDRPEAPRRDITRART